MINKNSNIPGIIYNKFSNDPIQEYVANIGKQFVNISNSGFLFKYVYSNKKLLLINNQNTELIIIHEKNITI